MNKHLVFKEFTDNVGTHKAGTYAYLPVGRSVKLEALHFVGSAIEGKEPVIVDGAEEIKELKAIISDTVKALKSAKKLADFKEVTKKLSETIAEDED